MFFKPSVDPLTGMTLSFVTGIALQLCVDVHTLFTWWFCAALMIIGVCLLMYRSIGSGIKFAILLTACITGIGLAFIKSDLLREGHFCNSSPTYKEWEGVVINEPRNSYNRTRFIVEIKSIRIDGRTSPSCGRLLCYVDTSNQSFGPGTMIRFSGIARRIRGPLHPDRFDKEAYYRTRNVFNECYTRSVDTIPDQPDPTMRLRKIAYGWKQRIVQTFREKIHDDTTVDIITALTCGYKDEIDESTRNIFSRSGVVHVLCVSGLHTGLVFALFLTIIRALILLRKIPRILWIILLIPVWLYAMMTGLSDSVVRASVMITLYNVARFSRSDISPLNIVAGSALLIVIHSPNQILSLGFQLSYLAVIGIILMHQYFINQLNISSKAGRWIGEAASMSLSAQITTSPLAAYTFKMLPFYFLPANLIAIPITTLLVYLSFIFILICRVPILSDMVIIIITFLVKVLVHCLGFIESLPGSFTEFADVNLWIPLTMYTLLICTYLIRSKTILTKVRWYFGILIIAMMSYRSGILKEDFDNSAFIIFQKREPVLHFRDETRKVPENSKIIVEYPGHKSTIDISKCATDRSLIVSCTTEENIYQKKSKIFDNQYYVSFKPITQTVRLWPYSSLQLKLKDH